MSAEIKPEIITGPVDQTIRDFLRTAPPGSDLKITGDNSAERVIPPVEPSVFGNYAEAAYLIRDRISSAVAEAGTIFREKTSPETG